MVRRGTWLAFALWLAAMPVAFAQTVAQLGGTVLDESGGALPGVDVSVTQTDTGFTRAAVTDSRGEFSIPSLPVGPYKLSAKLSGFSTFEQSGIVLRVGETRSVNPVLKLGNISETI